MKKTILTIAILLATVFGISQSSFAATSHEEVTTLNEVGNINKIEIHGNVELYVSDGTTDEVKVYNHYYAESALVQDQNGVLRISSYSTQKLVVWVKVSDLRDIAIYDDAEVKSFGKLSAIDLDVKLYNNASARLNMDAYSANVTLNGHAKADLTGELVEGSVSYDKS
ncbi:MAG: GIN domain-containing protein, partial [Mucilaginibacter sp.]